MRIVHLVHQYPPDYVGGVEIYTRQLARCQVESGHQIWVAAPVPTIGKPKITLEEGVQVWRIPVGARSRATVFAAGWRQPALTHGWAQLLAQARPDIVHIQHLMGWPLAVVAQIRQAGIPYVVTLHDYWFPCANAQLITNDAERLCQGPDARWANCARCAQARAGVPGPAWLGRPLAPLLAARSRQGAAVLRSAAAVVAPTAFVRAAHAEAGLPTDNFTLIAHGIEYDPALIRRARAQVAPHTDFHIGYVGSVARQKGVHVLVAAVNQLPATGVRLSIVGDLTRFPDYARQVQAQARHPGIRFLGPLPREHVWSFKAAVHVGVLPTLWYEASPLTIDEWFAVGAPMVGSRLGALPEKITDTVNGLLTPPGDVAALAQVLERLRLDPAERARLAAGIGAVRTMEQHAAEIDALYHRLLLSPATQVRP